MYIHTCIHIHIYTYMYKSAQIISVYLDESLQTEHPHVTSNQTEKQNILSTSQKSSSGRLPSLLSSAKATTILISNNID